MKECIKPSAIGCYLRRNAGLGGECIEFGRETRGQGLGIGPKVNLGCVLRDPLDK